LLSQGLFSFTHELEREHGNVVELRGVAHKRIDPGLHERANSSNTPMRTFKQTYIFEENINPRV